MTHEDEAYDAPTRLDAARHHLVATNHTASAQIEAGLRALVTACRATAFLETDPARADALRESADHLEDEIDRIRDVTARAWDATLHRPFQLTPAEGGRP